MRKLFFRRYSSFSSKIYRRDGYLVGDLAYASRLLATGDEQLLYDEVIKPVVIVGRGERAAKLKLGGRVGASSDSDRFHIFNTPFYILPRVEEPTLYRSEREPQLLGYLRKTLFAQVIVYDNFAVEP